MVVETEEGMEGIDLLMRDLTEYFYIKNVFVASPQTERPQRAFTVLTGHFNRFGLWKNKRKMASMACHPCHAPDRMLVESYERQKTGAGPIFQERQRRRVNCLE